MALREELHRQGQFWFRHRGKTSLLFLGLFLLALRDSEWIEDRFGDSIDDIYDFSCLAVSCLGLAIRFSVAGIVPARTSGRNTAKGQVADALNTTGPYSVMRHPLYVGNFLIILGICLAPGSLQYAVAASLIFWLIHERVMLAEEEFLRRRFGAEFEHWASRTPALVPAMAGFRPASLPFSIRTAIKREYLTVLATLLMFAAVDYLEDALAGASSRLEWEPETSVPAVVAAMLCVLLRLLRKRTRVLHLTGR